MKVLSLFDGISCARVALERAGFQIEKYFASEVDKYAVQVSLKNYPDNIQLGDVKEVTGLTDIDLLIGGSPCQDLSIAKANRKGLDGDRSSLFWEYVRILKEVKPKYFILENVNSMPKEAKAIITEALGVEPIMINAALVSAQNRKRLFWTNIQGITQPTDCNIFLKDILLDEVDSVFFVTKKTSQKYITKNLVPLTGKAKSMTSSMWKGIGNDGCTTVRVGHLNSGGQGDRIYSTDGKSVCLSANGGGRGAKTGLYEDTIGIRKLTPIECERLQSLNDDYTSGISNTQRYKCLGNAFNVDVVAHILSFIKK